ncbi:low molecular weight protein-tyrosine-phosphatase [Companilactobacillus sp. HBUAS59544]|jgi:protein-tyrosine phosphatase|uniref:low molecular weight protein-tyrosine-phosphatase n=1 Tax=Companilactobacillus sp. HBUAS59544 TaxID=3109363 RepID=UPI002FF0B4F7
MKKIIFVCLGNICRSPMAEMMMRDLVAQRDLNQVIEVESRATSTYEIGNSPHPGAIAELRKENIPLVPHSAKQISQTDFDSAALIIGMDQQNISDLKAMAPEADRDKIHLAYEIMNKQKVIEDPWYDHKFDRTFHQLSEVLPLWLDQLSK